MTTVGTPYLTSNRRAVYFVFQSAQGGNGDWAVSIPHDNFAGMDGGADMKALLEPAFGDFEEEPGRLRAELGGGDREREEG